MKKKIIDHSRLEMRLVFGIIFGIVFGVIVAITPGIVFSDTSDATIPQWIKKSAGWWADDLISDQEFIFAIEFMIQNKILVIPNSDIAQYSAENIPLWIKKNAGWWADGQISDSEFIFSMQHLIKTNIIKVSQNAQDVILEKLPASSSTIVNFYVNDDDLNTSHNGIDKIPTDGLVIATVNDQIIIIPEVMIETEPNSGRFYLRIELPATINGKPLDQDDIIQVKYFDQSDYSGNQRIVVSSTTLSKSFAKVETRGNNQRIGHEFILKVYEPDANRDSKDEDRIPLSTLEFRAEGGIRVPLSKDTFDANSSYLIETGPNSNIFEVEITIPRTISGKTIHIGDWYEIRYIDESTPSNTGEKIIFRGTIGLR